MGTIRICFLVINLTVAFVLRAYAQVTLNWARCYNGPANGWDIGLAITVDDSGYVYVTGTSDGIGTDSDYATIKYKPNGDSAWVRRYNGPENGFDIGRSIATDTRGNAYVTGGEVTIKYAPDGTQLWASQNAAECIAIEIAADGYIYVAGSGFQNFVTNKFDTSGILVWRRIYNGPANNSDYINDMTLDSQGNIIVTGQSLGIGMNWDYATVKYSPNGGTLWVRRYHGPSPSSTPDDFAYAVTVDDSDNIYVTGRSDGINDRPQCFTIKYSPNGDSLWGRRYPSGGTRGYAGDDILYNRGFIYVVARANGFDDTLLKYDIDGNLIWTRAYVSNHTFATNPPRLAVDTSGNIYMTSINSVGRSDYIVLKYAPDGRRLWEYAYPGSGTNMSNEIFALAVDQSANVYVTGGSHACPPGEFNYLTLKLSQNPTHVGEPPIVPKTYELQQNYPNPFNPATTISFSLPSKSFASLKVFDALGREVAILLAEELPAGTYARQWDAAGLPSGVYFYRLQAGKFTETKKLILLR